MDKVKAVFHFLMSFVFALIAAAVLDNTKACAVNFVLFIAGGLAAFGFLVAGIHSLVEPN